MKHAKLAYERSPSPNASDSAAVPFSSTRHRSFGNQFSRRANVFAPANIEETKNILLTYPEGLLTYGKGKSYGDCCLNRGGALIDASFLSTIHHFDPTTGLVDCDAGVTLKELLRAVVLHGWFVPVVPSTKGITVGGAIANDIHGRDHHRQGTFGSHVMSLSLLRSSGEILECSREKNAELFRATIGGLGLTGVILRARFHMKRVSSSTLDFETVPFRTLEAAFQLTENPGNWTYVTAWLDAFTSFESGYVMRAVEKNDHHYALADAVLVPPVPTEAPSNLLNPTVIKWMNAWTRFRHRKYRKGSRQYETLLYQLDGLPRWNYLYGRPGLVQYHCVLPKRSLHLFREIFDRISLSNCRPYLSILKPFGDKPSPGLMSFPMEGYMAALDFSGAQKPQGLFRELDLIVVKAGGRVYPAKDSCLTAETYAAMYPELDRFKKSIDPKFQSDFWARVRG